MSHFELIVVGVCVQAPSLMTVTIPSGMWHQPKGGRVSINHFQLRCKTHWPRILSVTT